jgi:thiaminase/transcriptional activator TenA
MLHESLWQQNADITKRCLEHTFVRGLADGTLDCDVFRQYVAQDAFFLRAFLKAYALAAA